MVNELCLCIEIFVIDVLVWFLIKKILKLDASYGGLFLSQVCNIAVLICFLFVRMEIWQFVLIKFAAVILISLLNVDSYRIKSIFILVFSFTVLSLTIYGYFEFLALIIESLNIIHFANQVYFKIILFGCFVIFYLTLYSITSLIAKNRNLQSFLADVSFFIGDRHIRLKGLIDSGNSFYDSKSNLPVVLLSLDCLKNFIPLATDSYVNDILASHFEKCVVVGGKKFYVPIVNVKACKVIKNGQITNKKFVIGVVKQSFYDEKHYDCLLHRDFV